MVKFLDLKDQYINIKDEIDDAIKNVINDSAFIGGKYVHKFEEEFAEYQQAKHCVGVANGTDGLEIVLEALNLPKSSEIIVPSNSFISTAEAVTRAGHKVVFCDCNKVFIIPIPLAPDTIAGLGIPALLAASSVLNKIPDFCNSFANLSNNILLVD